MEINLLIFDKPPGPLHKDIIDVTSLTIHADPDILFFQPFCEIYACKLSSLVSVKNLRVEACNACSRDDRQKAVSSVVETSQDRAKRLYQSMTCRQ
jgi:hypothetical protein